MSALSGCIVVEGQQRALLLCVAEERQSKLHQLLRAASSLSYIGARSWPYPFRQYRTLLLRMSA